MPRSVGISTVNFWWRLAGTASGGKSWAPPSSPALDLFRCRDDLLPAEELWVRFSARQKDGQNAPPALQLNAYRYEAALDGDTVDLVGTTNFVTVTHDDPQLEVAIRDIGDAIPGGATWCNCNCRTDPTAR